MLIKNPINLLSKQTQAWDYLENTTSPVVELGYGGGAGGGKLLALDTPIPTKDGWTTMGDIQVGDTIFDENGKLCSVIVVEPITTDKTYELTFSDGEKIVAGASHRWLTETYSDRRNALRRTDDYRKRRRALRKPRGIGKRPDLAKYNALRVHALLGKPISTVKTTQEIVDTLYVGKRANHAIPVCKPLELPEQNLLIDPYVLGVWLGDGSTNGGQVTGIDEDIFTEITQAGYTVTRHTDPISRGILGLQVQLREIGVLGNKHIPQTYLRASIQQRLALLQGLMDTDGYADTRGQCEFSITNKQLAQGAHELIISLGIKATISIGRAKLYGRDCGETYSIKFITDLPAFRLPRKLTRQKRDGFRGTHARRYIVAAKEIPSVPMRCIAVDSPSHLYLAGRGMIPTHNTNLGCKLAIFLSDVFPGSRGAIGRFELKNLKRTTLASFFEVAIELGLKQKQRSAKDWDYDYNQQDGIIRFRNGSEILILDTAPSPKDPLYTRFGGLELSWCWIDESNETPYKAIEILSTRVGRRNKNKDWEANLKQFFGMYDDKDGWVLKPIFLETFNPEKGHIYTRFWKPFKDNTMPTYRCFVRALASDNPFLPRAYIAAIMRQSKATIERLIYGNFDYDDDPSKIFNYDKITDLFSNVHVTGQVPDMDAYTGKQKMDKDGKPLTKPAPRYLSGDIAGKGKDKTVLYVWEGLKVIHIYKEDVTDQDKLYDKIMELKQQFNIPTSNIVLDYDGIGVGIVDRLKCKGFQAGAAAFTTQEEEQQGLKANYKNLRSQCWFKLADLVNDAAIYIACADADAQEKITEELDVIKEINDGKDQKRQIIPKGGVSQEDENRETIKSLLGRSSDYGDGLMMRMFYEVVQEPEPGIRFL